MRRAARTDDNQNEIVDALRKIGATVQPLHAVGKGCPDILVGWRGMNTLLEIKDSNKPASAIRLTQDQIKWHAMWGGQVTVVKSIQEAIEAVTR